MQTQKAEFNEAIIGHEKQLHGYEGICTDLLRAVQECKHEKTLAGKQIETHKLWRSASLRYWKKI